MPIAEPESVDLLIDGVNDLCSRGEDINFQFTGFGVVGKVSVQSLLFLSVECRFPVGKVENLNPSRVKSMMYQICTCRLALGINRIGHGLVSTGSDNVPVRYWAWGGSGKNPWCRA